VIRNVRTYGHFCLVARALERVGDRWSLLVIRDLLTGAKRFTDLMDRLGGITPKTLSQRLRELDEDGIVIADREPGRREVWYRLTPAGADLEPVVEALNQWGLRHAWRPPQPGEPLHAEHLLRTAVQAIDAASGDHQPAHWHFRLDGNDYLVHSETDRWRVTAEAPSTPAEVTVTGTAAALAALIFNQSDQDLAIAGDTEQIQRLKRLLATLATLVPPAQPRQTEHVTTNPGGP
jgi:DNA-binding HxlR family transcriptional regulator